MPELPWMKDEPVAVVQRLGRWRHLVYIAHGPMRYGPDNYGWHCWGRTWAEAKARRELARYQAQLARRAERWIVRGGYRGGADAADARPPVPVPSATMQPRRYAHGYAARPADRPKPPPPTGSGCANGRRQTDVP